MGNDNRGIERKNWIDTGGQLPDITKKREGVAEV